MPVFEAVFFRPAFGRMGVIVILGMGFAIVDFPRRVMVQFEKFAVALQHFSDYVGVVLAEQAVALQDPIARPGHFAKPGFWQFLKSVME
jgi:hypothetical protein